jgi:hypothetical protein
VRGHLLLHQQTKGLFNSLANQLSLALALVKMDTNTLDLQMISIFVIRTIPFVPPSMFKICIHTFVTKNW